MKKFSLFVILALLQTGIFPSPAGAADQDIPLPVRMPYRIVRGAVNIGLGWTEILLRPLGERAAEPAWEAVSKGAINAAIRTGIGVEDIVTFWVPDMQMEELYPDWQTWPYLFHWS